MINDLTHTGKTGPIRKDSKTTRDKADSARTDRSGSDEQEDLLDEALKETFPGSDAISPAHPSERKQKK